MRGLLGRLAFAQSEGSRKRLLLGELRRREFVSQLLAGCSNASGDADPSRSRPLHFERSLRKARDMRSKVRARTDDVRSLQPAPKGAKSTVET